MKVPPCQRVKPGSLRDLAPCQPGVALSLALLLACPAQAAGFALLHSFQGSPDEASGPAAGVALHGGRLYGVTQDGGKYGLGILFSISPEGTDPQAILHFADAPRATYPNGSIVIDGTVAYGVTGGGGDPTYNAGCVYRVNIDGTGFTHLHDFTMGSDGSTPRAGLVRVGNTLFGTTLDHGYAAPFYGTLFKINMDGTGYSVLHSFGSSADDGRFPVGPLVADGNTIYGTTQYGGVYEGGTPLGNGMGTVFRIQADGSSYVVLHRFSYSWNERDGSGPIGGLLVDGGMIYGTTAVNGTNWHGTVFRLHTDGTGYTTLHDFGDYPDGQAPAGGFALMNQTLVGTTQSGGGGSATHYGTLYKIRTDGTGYAVLHNFTDIDGGAAPMGHLALDGLTYYGTTRAGGSRGCGTLYSYTLLKPYLKAVTGFDGPVPVPIITWQDDGQSHLLFQAKSPLASKEEWELVPPPYETNGTELRYLVPLPQVTNAPARFYRLGG